MNRYNDFARASEDVLAFFLKKNEKKYWDSEILFNFAKHIGKEHYDIKQPE